MRRIFSIKDYSVKLSVPSPTTTTLWEDMVRFGEFFDW